MHTFEPAKMCVTELPRIVQLIPTHPPPEKKPRLPSAFSFLVINKAAAKNAIVAWDRQFEPF